MISIVEDVFQHEQVFVQVSEFTRLWPSPEASASEILFNELPKNLQSQLGRKAPHFTSKRDAVNAAKRYARVLVREGFTPDVTVLFEEKDVVTYIIAPPFNVQVER